MKRRTGTKAITLSFSLLIGVSAQGQILNRSDLERDLARYQAAAANTQTMPPLQAGLLWSHLGTLYQDAGRYAQAEQALERSTRLLSAAPVSTPALAATTDALGTLYLQTGHLADAERAETKAWHMREQAALKGDLPVSWYHLANLYLRLHQPSKAQSFAERAVAAFAADPQADLDNKLGSSLVLAAALCQQHKYSQAIERLQALLPVAKSTSGGDSFPAGMTQFLLGYAYFKSGDPAAALDPMQQGSQIIGRELRSDHPSYLVVMENYARLLRAEHRGDEARDIEKQVRETRARLATDPAYARTLHTVDIAALF